MRTVIRLLFSLCAILVICAGCTNNEADPYTREGSANDELFAQYHELYQRPTVSALEIALGKITPPANESYNVALTDDDVRYLLSLKSDQLIQLKRDIMKLWRIESDEECEAIVDEGYNRMFEGLDDEELIRFRDFLQEYIEMPMGPASLKQFEALNEGTGNSELYKRYLVSAVAIDKFGRNLFMSLDPGTRSEAYCKKYFGMHLAVASISFASSCLVGFVIPGPTWIAVASALCETATAIANYQNCLKTRAE